MPAKKDAEHFDPVAALLGAFATNQRINLYLIENLAEEAWSAPSPVGRGRNVSALVAHLHNVRLMWLKAAAKDSAWPGKLEGEFTKAEAAASLGESYQALDGLIREALRSDGRVKNFKPDAVSFVGYLIAHDAHHRGQIAMLARQLGHPLPQKAMFGMWEWGTR